MSEKSDLMSDRSETDAGADDDETCKKDNGQGVKRGRRAEQSAKPDQGILMMQFCNSPQTRLREIHCALS